MKVESISFSGAQAATNSDKPVRLDDARKQKDNKDVETTKKSGLPPEEILNKIKALTEDGVYSVRFETDDKTKEMVVKVVDPKTDEVLRQIPPESLLDLRASLEELRGNIVNTQS